MSDPGWADALHPLLRECHRRLSTGTRVTRVTLGPLDRAEQDAVADLLGLPVRPTAGASVRLADVERAVREVTGKSLRAVLHDLYGAVGDRAADRARSTDARSELWAWLREHEVVRRQGLGSWVNEVESSGLRGAVDARRHVLEQALLVLDALPGSGEPLPVLAGRVLNDTHALDGSSGLASLVLAAVASRQGVARPTRAADRRALWHSVGISDDALSSTVLVAGLDAVGESVPDALCRLALPRGRATCLTLADVRDGLPVLRRTSAVWVVENPAVLALAVDELGRGVPPMVCVSGWPSSAATLLLEGLAGAGHGLRYHGDLDGEGVRIAAHVVQETGAVPWRMTTADYRAHVAPAGAGVGRVTPAPWDPDLAPEMRARGVAVLEETVWDVLRDDLVDTS